MELSQDMSDKMMTGKQMFVAALNAQQKTMAFPIPLKGFGKASDGAPVDAAAYQEARAQMIQASRQHQLELGKKAAAMQQEKQQAVGQPQVAPPAAAPAVSSLAKPPVTRQARHLREPALSHFFLCFLTPVSWSTNPPLHSGSFLSAAFA